MNKLAAVVSAALFGVVAVPASADFYLGGKAGGTWLDDSCSDSSFCNDDDFGAGGFAGYGFNDYVGLELGYDFFGTFQSSFPGGNVNDSLHAITLAPKFTWKFNPNWGLYGKVGGAYVDHGPIEDFTYMGAVGLEFDSLEQWSVRFEYQSIPDIDDNVADSLGANFFSLGIAYHFGRDKPVVVPPPPPPPPEPVIMTKSFEQVHGVGLFELNSAKLSASSESALADLVELMNTYPQAKVQIVGYTDSSGKASYNQKLSEKRAMAVSDYLESRGISSDRISARGEGENNPIADNGTKEGRMKNRRVEITVPEFEYEEVVMPQ
ncbi:Outer membrane protein A [Vibrio stylophorae]|uniref:Outer membrane protein A n=1 Tax=Vibrio stylophorae TaxID=659351 RepID=A0ABM8ZU64_9VIBR|nr:OmpA family protein [Vibrio stylophorae]CAH0533854.1 Outer membrane protein A [Vibrio stylophorae]